MLQIRSIFIETRRRPSGSRSVAESTAASSTQLAGERGLYAMFCGLVTGLVALLNPELWAHCPSSAPVVATFAFLVALLL